MSGCGKSVRKIGVLSLKYRFDNFLGASIRPSCSMESVSKEGESDLALRKGSTIESADLGFGHFSHFWQQGALSPAKALGHGAARPNPYGQP